MIHWNHKTTFALLALVATIVLVSRTQAQYTPVFYDGFAVSQDTFNMNLEFDTRQSGVLAPAQYVSSTQDVNDGFQHQLFSEATAPGQPLQLAENGFNPPGVGPIFSYKTMVSPTLNFDGTVGGEIVGKRVSFTLDVGVIAEEPSAGAGTFTHAGITIGAPATLIDSEDEIGVQTGEPIRDYFSIQFVEDKLMNGLGSFMQAFDGADGGIPTIGTVVQHGGGDGLLSVQLDVDDPVDGNPWDGVGSTLIDVSVNGNQIFSFEKTDGGYTDNYITLFGSRQFNLNRLATHLFDDFTVFSAPLVVVEGVPGDYNGDEVVDLADYTVWRDNLGAPADVLPAGTRDGSNSGPINAADYTFWKQQFGSGGTATLAASVAAVPEPASSIAVLLLSATLAIRLRGYFG